MAVQITTLPSGLRIVTDSLPHVETVAISLWFDVGTRHETPQQNGIAHLLEHMVFKGTKRRSALQIAEEIENVGGHTNAYTSREHTAYYARLMGKDLALGIDLLLDMVQNSTFDATELAREQEVIVQEIGQANDTPDELVFDYFQEAAYGAGRLGQPILGKPAIIKSVTSADLHGYKSRHYALSNMVVSVAGKARHEDVLELVQKNLSGWQRHDLPSTVADPYSPIPKVEARDLEQVNFVVGFPAVGATHPDYFAYSIYSTLLGGGSSSRLFQEVREKRGLVYSIYSFLSNVADSGLFGVYAGTSDEHLGVLLPVLKDQLWETSKALSDAEIDRAKAQMQAGLLMGLEQSFNRAEYHATNLLTYGRLVFAEEWVDRIEKVQKEDLLRIASHMLSSKPAVAAIGPAQAVAKIEKFSAI